MLHQFIQRFATLFPDQQHQLPWTITNDLHAIITAVLAACGEGYRLTEGIAIHHTAVIEQNVVLKPPLYIGANCFVGANAYLRGPVYLDTGVVIGAGCEIKQSIIFSHTAIAHFNYIGNSLIGSDVNFEAGSVAANHFNERANKNIQVLHQTAVIDTQATKFGAVVGDGSKIGANAVLSPGTLLLPLSVVKRLELVEQIRL